MGREDGGEKVQKEERPNCTSPDPLHPVVDSRIVTRGKYNYSLILEEELCDVTNIIYRGNF